jgi:hypothetical protein
MNGWPHYLPRWTYSPPSVADLDNDGVVEIIVGVSGSVSYPSDNLYAFKTDGSVVPGFPVNVHGSAEGPTGIGDLEGDGYNYIAFDNNLIRTSDNLGNIYVCDRTGFIDEPYPLQPWGWTYMNGIQLADLNRNGVMELVNISSYETTANVNVWSQRDFYGNHPVEWETYHADNHRTGMYNPMGGNTLPESFSLVGPDSGTVGGCVLDLTWEAAVDPDGGEVNYWVFYDTTANMQNPRIHFAGPQSSIDTDDLYIEIGVDFYWYVTADDGNSSWVTSSNQKFWSFRLTGLDVNGDSEIPDNYIFLNNYPNPFNSSTLIEFNLNTPGNVNLSVYNIKGQFIERIHEGFLSEGFHSIVWNASELPSGIYFCKLKIIDGVISKKIVLLK